MDRQEVVDAIVTEFELSQNDVEWQALENLAWRLGLKDEVEEILRVNGWFGEEGGGF